ncbi:MAG: PAS domain S-box protein, partial [Pseudomonadota bacterium]
MDSDETIKTGRAGDLSAADVYDRAVDGAPRRGEKTRPSRVGQGRPRGFFQFSLTGRILFVNNAFAVYFGRQSALELTGSVGDEAALLFAEPLGFARLRDLAPDGGGAVETQGLFRGADGRYFSAGIRAWTTGEGAGRILEGLLEDSGEKECFVNEFDETRERYRALFEQSLDCVCLHDRSGRFIDANGAALALLGYGKEELLSLPIEDLLGPEDRAKLAGGLDDAWTGSGEKELLILKLKAKSGRRVFVEASRTVLFRDGRPHAVQYVGRDVTERREYERALKDSERRLAQIINFLPDPTFVIDSRRTVAAWNQALEKLTGVPAESMLGKGEYEYAIPFYGCRRPVLIDLAFDHDPEVEKKYTYVKREGDILFSETGNPAFKPGAILWNTARLLRDVDGNPMGAIESIRDITERVRAQEYLRESEERYRSILENMQEGYYEVDLGGNIKFCNEAMARMVGLPKEEMTGQCSRDAVARESVDEVFHAFNEVFLTGRAARTAELKFIDRDGRERFFE